MTTIRQETPFDIPAIHILHQKAFGGREAEAMLVDDIRRSEHFIPELSLVAGDSGHILGHILFSRIHIETAGGHIAALALAPMAVLPEYQKMGIGTGLVRQGLVACKQLEHSIVIVLGHSDYYPRFGFSARAASSLECPFGDCGSAWMALELVPGALQGVHGRVVYPPAFDQV